MAKIPNIIDNSAELPDVDLRYIKTYTEVMMAYASQLEIQNELLTKILENTNLNSDLKNTLKSVQEYNKKFLNFIESRDGLSKLILEQREFHRQQFDKAVSRIVLRISLILAGAGALFNAIIFWVQKILNSSHDSQLIQQIVHEVLKQLGH